jgi:hypothetical protein
MRCALHSALDLDAPGRSAGQSDSPNQFFNRIDRNQPVIGRRNTAKVSL